MLIAIDPGKKSIAAAWFDDGVLVDASYRRRETVAEALALIPDYRLLDLAIVEVPQVYRSSRSKGDPNDLIDVAVMAGACCTIAREVKLIHPRRWKGSVPKNVMTQRILSKLTAAERDLLKKCLTGVRASLHHNVVDACGIGLWHLGRL